MILKQTKLIDRIIKKFGQENAHTARVPLSNNLDNCGDLDTKFPYRSLVGSLMYLSTGTRPDISYAVKELSRFLENPRSSVVTAAKQVVRYIKGTTDQGIVYEAKEGHPWCDVHGWSDSDFAGEKIGRSSTTGYVIQICGCTISWKSSSQTIVAQSTAEAEYIALWTLGREVSFIFELITDSFRVDFKDKLPSELPIRND